MQVMGFGIRTPLVKRRTDRFRGAMQCITEDGLRTQCTNLRTPGKKGRPSSLLLDMVSLRFRPPPCAGGVLDNFPGGVSGNSQSQSCFLIKIAVVHWIITTSLSCI